MKRKPNGFVAVCQCGATVGAMGYERTGRRDAGQLLGRWLADGCTIKPQFSATWKATIEQCQCDTDPRKGMLAGDVLAGGM
mgnify:CR=1 FL=1